MTKTGSLLLQQTLQNLLKALSHLQYSYNKVSQFNTIDVDSMDEETLATWESFCARFSRVSDIFLMQYLRFKTLNEDPGFDGTLRDGLNFAEKHGWIDDATYWLSIRELRNVAVHDYASRDLSQFFQRLRNECPKLLALEKCI